jgi:hypothetical protein
MCVVMIEIIVERSELLSRSLQTSLPARNLMLENTTGFDDIFDTVMSKMTSAYPENDNHNIVQQIKWMILEASDMKLDMGKLA